MSVPARPDDADLAADVGRELQQALGRHMEQVVREWRALLADVERRQQGYVPAAERDDLALVRDYSRAAIDAFERIGREGAGRLDQVTPDQLSWLDLAAETTRDEASGRAVWARLRQTARNELACGKTGALTVEGRDGRPFERAEYLALWTALADGLQPRNGLERVLVDEMAQALTMHRKWLRKHVLTESYDAMQVEQDVRQRAEWQPPRLRDVEAVDRAALMADRFQRQFLRLLKTYRDQRRLLGTLVVAAGGQLNVGERQVNVGTGRADGDG
jgi:hypothetical protein